MADPYPNDEEDGDLKRAIALSLEQSDLPPNETVVIDDSETESEDEDVKRAIALSLADDKLQADNRNDQLPKKSSVDGKIDTQTLDLEQPKRVDCAIELVKSGGFAGLDRKAMEQERLARLASRKREAPTSPPKHQPDRPEKRAKASASTPTIVSQLPTPKSTPTSSLQYPRGVIKKTWSKSYPSDTNAIKFEEVIRKDELKTAFFSSFMWDSEWFFSKINTKTTKIILAMQTKTEQEREEQKEEARAYPNVRMCFPPLRGAYTCMHSKLMLLFYADSLRIVVPTANIAEDDLGETGVMENSVFLIDLPRRKDGKPGVKDDLTFFGKELLYFLEKMDLQQNMRDGVLNFDFSSTDHLAFIHAIFGPQYDEDLQRTGYPGLSAAIRQLDLATEKSLQLDFASSSIGSLDDLTINNLYEAARGTDLARRDPKGLKAENASTKANFRIYFPTHETVAKSLGGTKDAGTISTMPQYFNKAGFPKSSFRDYKSARKGLLSHNKLLFGRGSKKLRAKEEDTKEPVAWVYVGSANLSESAWGRMVTDKSRKANKLTCNNWECGVLVSVPVEGDPLEMSLGDVFKGAVDVPFEYPGEEYGNRLPWFFKGG